MGLYSERSTLNVSRKINKRTGRDWSFDDNYINDNIWGLSFYLPSLQKIERLEALYTKVFSKKENIIKEYSELLESLFVDVKKQNKNLVTQTANNRFILWRSDLTFTMTGSFFSSIKDLLLSHKKEINDLVIHDKDSRLYSFEVKMNTIMKRCFCIERALDIDLQRYCDDKSGYNEKYRKYQAVPTSIDSFRREFENKTIILNFSGRIYYYVYVRERGYRIPSIQKIAWSNDKILKFHFGDV